MLLRSFRSLHFRFVMLCCAVRFRTIENSHAHFQPCQFIHSMCGWKRFTTSFRLSNGRLFESHRSAHTHTHRFILWFFAVFFLLFSFTLFLSTYLYSWIADETKSKSTIFSSLYVLVSACVYEYASRIWLCTAILECVNADGAKHLTYPQNITLTHQLDYYYSNPIILIVIVLLV